MAAAALLAKTPKPTDKDIDGAMAGNYCRCGTYLRIRQAIHQAAGQHEMEGRNGAPGKPTPVAAGNGNGRNQK